MLNLKPTTSRRGIRRQRQDDLSIITGFSSLKRRNSLSDQQPNSKRVRLQNDNDENLKQQFLQARSEALSSNLAVETTEDKLSDSLSRLQFKISLEPYKYKTDKDISTLQTSKEEGKSEYFQDLETPGLSRFKARASASAGSKETTIQNVPAFVTAADCKKVLTTKSAIRGILKPSTANVQVPRRSESDYWTSFIRRSDELYKKRGKSRVHEVGLSRPSTVEGWSACSSFPITRETASLVQQEMATSLASSASSKGSRTPTSERISLSSEDNVGFNNTMPPPQSTPLPFLMNYIKPPSATGSGDLFSYANNNGTPGVVVGEWVSRGNFSPAPPITKKYSVAQLVDILCGYTTPVDSELTGQIFQPDYYPLPTPSPVPPATYLPQDHNLLVLSTKENQTVTILPEPNAKPPSKIPATLPMMPNNEIFLIPGENQNPAFKEGQVSSQTKKFNLFNDEVPGKTFDTAATDESEYFRFGNIELPAKKTKAKIPKSVSFLTDSQNNICTKEYSFNDYFSATTSQKSTSASVLGNFSSTKWDSFQIENKENALSQEIFGQTSSHLQLNFAPSSEFGASSSEPLF